MAHRELKPEELLAALDAAAPGSDDPLLRLGHALREAAPKAEGPDPFFASRLKAQLLSAPMPQPKVPVAALILPLVGVVAVAAVVFALPQFRPAGSPEGGTLATDSAARYALGAELTLASGEVRWRADASAAWQAAEEGLPVGPGVELDVPGDGRAVVTLDDGSALRLNGKTTVAIERLDRDAVRVREDRGTAYFRVMKDAKRTFTVATAEGDVTALGTAFAVARDAEKKTLDVHCLESKVKVALAKDGTKLEKEIAQGKTLSYDAKKDPGDGTTIADIDPKKIAEVPFFKWNLREDAKEGQPLGVVTEVPKPELAITSIANGAVLPDEGPVEVAGKTEPGLTVLVNGKEAVANDDGSWSTTVELKDGFQTIDVKVQDPLSGDAIGTIGVTVGAPTPVAVAPTPAPKPAPVVTDGITLSGALSGTTAKLSWKVTGVDVSGGFKVVYNKTGSPVYPGDSASYQNADVRSAAIGGMPAGKTVYFRICAYRDGTCSDYSNQVKLTVPAETTTTGAVSIALQGIVSGTTASLKWTTSGDVSQGFKVIWNTSGSPTYPGDNPTYVDGGTRAFSVKGLPENASVYLRVCAYTGNGCSTYSNQIKLQTGATTVKTGGYNLLTGEQQVTASVTGNGVQLSWTPCSASDFLYYKVVRSETNPDPYYPNDGYVTAISNQQATGYTDSSAVSGKSYYYRICSKEGDGSVWCGNVVRVSVP